MEFRYDPQARRLRMRALVPAGHHAESFVATNDFKFGIEEEYFLSGSAKTLKPCPRRRRTSCSRPPISASAAASSVNSCRLKSKSRPSRISIQATRGATCCACARTRPRRQPSMALWSSRAVRIRWRTGAIPCRVPGEGSQYSHVMDVLQMIGQRDMLCGMHVHVEFPDPRRRIDVMRRITPYLPLFIALSTSSPFWQGHATGLKGYRLAAYDELPRTGFPDLFRDEDDYNAYVDALQRSGALLDASHLWWSIRPSLKYPTLELRAPDCCTRIDDTIALAALYRALAQLISQPLIRSITWAFEIDNVDRAIAVENKWRAQRYGVQGTFVTRSGPVPVADMLDRVVTMIEADGDALNCAEQFERCRSIVVEGTSADAQLRIFTESEHEGVDIALHKVIRWVRDATLVA